LIYTQQKNSLDYIFSSKALSFSQLTKNLLGHILLVN
jgi:hypothetical protein